MPSSEQGGQRREDYVAKEASDPNDDPEVRRVREHLRKLCRDGVWEGDLKPRLLLLALRKIGRIPWKGRAPGQIPGDEKISMAEDAISTAYVKFMSGKRRHWDWSKSDLRNFRDAVESEIINSGMKHGNTKTGVGSGDKDNDEDKDNEDNIVWLPDPGPGPEEKMEWQIECDRLLRYLRARDPEAALVATVMLQDVNLPELATALGGSQQEIDNIKKKIDNIKKRLRRLVNNYLAERRAAE
jgi:hypothetical protein